MRNRPQNDTEIDWSIRFVRFWRGQYLPATLPALAVSVGAMLLAISFVAIGEEAAEAFGRAEYEDYGWAGFAVTILTFLLFMDSRTDNPMFPWNR